MCKQEAKIKTEIDALPKDHPKCKHNNPEGYCNQCREEEEIKIHEENKRIREDKIKEQERRRIQHLMNHPEDKIKAYHVPTKYIECSLANFTGNKKLITECEKYKEGGLVLAGNTGCGKTHLAVAALREMIKADIIKETKLDRYGDFLPGAEMITVPDLLLKIRSSFKENSEATEEQIINHFSKIPVLILDDLGSEKTTEYAISTLYIIIDRRDREGLSTIITTNLTLGEIEKKLDARIASRLSGMKTIKINMPDYRKKR